MLSSESLASGVRVPEGRVRGDPLNDLQPQYLP